jgi:hypothetical protein
MRQLAQTSPLVLGPTLNKIEHTIPDQEFVKLKRLMVFAREHGMRAMYFCVQCEQPIKLTHEAPIALTDGSGPAAPVVRLDCACSRWVVR